MGESRIEKAIDYITTLFQGNGDGHDLPHSLRVYNNAMMIAKMEGEGEEKRKLLRFPPSYMIATIISFSIQKTMPIPEASCKRRDFLEEWGEEMN